METKATKARSFDGGEPETRRPIGNVTIGVTHFTDHPLYGDGGLSVGQTIDNIIGDLTSDGLKRGQISEISLHFERD